MTPESVLTLFIAVAILALTPGPGVFALVARSLAVGFRPVLVFLAGLILGDIIYLLLAICGMAAVANVMGELFIVVKILGGLYLVWLGWQALTSRPGPMDTERLVHKREFFRSFLGGLSITLGNPKVILFYIGFLPTFMDLAVLHGTDILVAVATVASALWTVLLGYAYLAARARRLFATPKAAQRLNCCAGTVMIGAGLAVATRQ